MARIDPAFWQAHPDWMWDMQSVVSQAQDAADRVRDEIQPAWNAIFPNAGES